MGGELKDKLKIVINLPAVQQHVLSIQKKNVSCHSDQYVTGVQFLYVTKIFNCSHMQSELSSSV